MRVAQHGFFFGTMYFTEKAVKMPRVETTDCNPWIPVVPQAQSIAP